MLGENSGGMSLRTQRLTWQKQTVDMACTECPHHAPGWHSLTPKPSHCPPGRTERMEGREGVLGGRCPLRDITQCPHSVSPGQPRPHTCPAPTSAPTPRPLQGSSQGSDAETHCPSAACPSPQEGPLTAQQDSISRPHLPGLSPDASPPPWRFHSVSSRCEWSSRLEQSARQCWARSELQGHPPPRMGPRPGHNSALAGHRKFLVPKAGPFSGQSWPILPIRWHSDSSTWKRSLDFNYSENMSLRLPRQPTPQCTPLIKDYC